MNEPKLRQKLNDFICQELLFEEDYPLTNDEPLLASGRLNSLLLVQLALFMEETFAVQVPDIDLTTDHFETVDRMVAWITASIQD